LISPRLTNEALATVQKISHKFVRVATFVAPNEASLCTPRQDGWSAKPNSLNTISDADLIIVLGATPSRDNGVVAARIRKAVRKNGAKLVVLNERKSDLDALADHVNRVVAWEDATRAAICEIAKGTQRPVVIYGPGATPTAGAAALEQLNKMLYSRGPGQPPELIALPVSANSFGTAAAGVNPVENVSAWLDAQPLDFLHIVASDEPDVERRLLDDKRMVELLQAIDCVVVQASYLSPLTELADVVLPSTIWAEKSGTITNMEGRPLPLRPVTTPVGSREDAKILESVFA